MTALYKQHKVFSVSKMSTVTGRMNVLPVE